MTPFDILLSLTSVEGGLRAISVGDQKRSVRVELHRCVVVGACRGAPVFHKPHPVSFGVRERPVAAHAVIVDGYVDL